ncbi:MFS transporter [Streptomyces sp. NPDC102360]|uniref:MFS transporter n=1 Tax=Streptomyces sp. NPDC102360 TaxID=3366160 RepID=UPI003808B364
MERSFADRQTSPVSADQATPEAVPTHRAAGSESSQLPGYTTGFAIRLVAAQFLISLALFTPVTVSLSLRVSQIDPDGKASSLSTVLAIGGFLALIGGPLFGALSDRTTSRFGRRRPWVAGGMAVGFVGLVVSGLADNIAVLACGWAITQLGVNAALAAMHAVLADRVPDRVRGRISGAVGMMTYVAMVVGAVLARALTGSSLLLFALPGVLGLAGAALINTALRGDPPADKGALPPFRIGSFLRSFWVSPRRHPDFAWNFVGRFLVFVGVSSATGYQLYFAEDQLGQSTHEATGTVAIGMTVMTIGAVFGSLFFGWLSDRTGRRKFCVYTGTAILAAGIAGLATAHSTGAFLAAITVFGLGMGAYLAVDTAIAVKTLPRAEDAAKDLGVLNVANALPQSLVPAIAPLFLGIASADRTNYLALYLFGAAAAAAGAVALRFIRAVR